MLKLLLMSNLKTKSLFTKYCQVSEEINGEHDVALIIRSYEMEPEIVERVVDETNGQIPVVVMTGAEDEIGNRYYKAALHSGVPEEYILMGTEWRVSDVIQKLEQALQNPRLPNVKISFEEIEKENDAIFNINVFDEQGSFVGTGEPPEEVAKAGEKTFSTPVIAVTGVNGGAGASTVALSLLAYLKNQGCWARLIDTSQFGDLSFHFSLPNEKGSHATPYGDVVFTHGDVDLFELEIQNPCDIAIIDLDIESPFADSILHNARHIVLVLTPSQLDYLKLKQVEERLAPQERVIVCLNKVDRSKPLRYSYVSLFENELAHIPTACIEDSDEVIRSVAEGVPAYERMREQFDQLFQHIQVNVINHPINT